MVKNALGFLVGMSEFSMSGAPIFSEDDHRVTFPVRCLEGPDRHALGSWSMVAGLQGISEPREVAFQKPRGHGEIL